MIMTKKAIRSRALDMLEKEIKPEIVLIAHEKWLRELIAKEIKEGK